MNLRVASAQFPVGPDPAVNARAVCELVSEAAGRGARLVVFPETALSGYTPLESQDPARFDWASLEAATERVRAAVASAGLWALVGTITASSDPDRPRNSMLLLGPEGGVQGRYDKRLLAASELSHFRPGDDPLLFELDGYRCGVVVCHEWRYPEVYREYARLGADLVCHGWYETYDDEGWEREGALLSEVIPAATRGHAVSNHLWIVGSNTSGGRSAFPPFIARPDGALLATGRRGHTEVLVADLTPRRGIPDGAAHHRPRFLGQSPAPGRLEAPG